MIFPDSPLKCFIILGSGRFCPAVCGDRGQLDSLTLIAGLWKGCVLGCACGAVEIFLLRWERHACSVEEDLHEFK